VVEHPVLGSSPYRVNYDGAPYVPTGDGGIVLGLQVGDPVFGLDADHAAPGACLVHPDPAARHALAAFSCIGNAVRVRTGAAAGSAGVVAGKRGEEGRVIISLAAEHLERLRPGDEVVVRACGQGWRPERLPAAVAIQNLDPGLLARVPVSIADESVTVRVRSVLDSRLAGNGIGRPSASWDLDLQLTRPPDNGPLLLGDLVAVSNLDARWNMGFRRGWITVGVLVHGASPQPGHGPGLTPILTGPATAISVQTDPTGHVGVSAGALGYSDGRQTVTPVWRRRGEGG
jgi:Domain of unknown function (DUF4438)